jgi:putative transposase
MGIAHRIRRGNPSQAPKGRNTEAMGQSLVKNYMHIVFSTKHREPLIHPPVEAELHAYLGGICNKLDCTVIKVGGYTDHIHILCMLSGAFSVNPSEVDTVIAYITNQHEHHSKKTFQDEYRAFLKKYKVEYDEKYVWD